MMPFKEAFGSNGPVRKTDGKIVDEFSLTALQQSLVAVTIIFIGVGGTFGGPVGRYGGH